MPADAGLHASTNRLCALRVLLWKRHPLLRWRTRDAKAGDNVADPPSIC